MAIAEIAAAAKEITKKVAQETANAVKEASKEASEVMTKKISDGKMLNEIRKEKISDYSKAYLSGREPKIKERILIAKRNPEARRALLKDAYSKSIRGRLNQLEIESQLEKCADIRREVSQGNNRVDILCENVRKPIRFNEMVFGKNGLTVKESIIKKGTNVAIECKEGDFMGYIKPKIAHSIEQVKAGKELARDKSLFQITAENLKDLEKRPLAEQKEFCKKINDVGGQIMVRETEKDIRQAALKQAMRECDGGLL